MSFPIFSEIVLCSSEGKESRPVLSSSQNFFATHNSRAVASITINETLNREEAMENGKNVKTVK